MALDDMHRSPVRCSPASNPCESASTDARLVHKRNFTNGVRNCISTFPDTGILSLTTKTVTKGHTCDTCKELPGKILDLVGRKWAERVVLEPVVYRLSQQIKHHADVIPVVETVVQVEAFAIN